MRTQINIKTIRDGWVDAHEDKDIPDWDEYFMSLAILTATRSKDSQTQYGAVFVRDRRILATGYNSFPRGMPDNKLPNTRPLKYPWMIHSEANALYNCNADTCGATCYVNGEPCNECLKALHAVGIKDWVILKGKSDMLKSYTQEQVTFRDALIEWGYIKIREIKITSAPLVQALGILNKSN